MFFSIVKYNRIYIYLKANTWKFQNISFVFMLLCCTEEIIKEKQFIGNFISLAESYREYYSATLNIISLITARVEASRKIRLILDSHHLPESCFN